MVPYLVVPLVLVTSSLKEKLQLHMGIGIVYCALLLFVVANTANAPEVYGSPQIQSKPLPLTSYEIVQIAKVVSTPQTYNLRLVRFKGIVTASRTIPRGIGMVPNEAHVFTLTDNTGAIEIFYTGVGGKNLGPVKTDLLVEGNMIDVLVIISYTTSPGSALEAKLTWVERPQD